jgi:hypothetical protein
MYKVSILGCDNAQIMEWVGTPTLALTEYALYRTMPALSCRMYL